MILHDRKKGRANVNKSRYILCLVRNGHSSIIAGSLSRGDGSCNRGRDRFEEQWMSVGGLVGRRMGKERVGS